MFEIGKEYTVWMAHPSGASLFTGILLKAELPLLCIEHGGESGSSMSTRRRSSAPTGRMRKQPLRYTRDMKPVD